MGFKRGGNIKKDMKMHSWINNPNNAHKLCTKCGMRLDIVTKNNTKIYTYTTKDGIVSNKFIECK